MWLVNCGCDGSCLPCLRQTHAQRQCMTSIDHIVSHLTENPLHLLAFSPIRHYPCLARLLLFSFVFFTLFTMGPRVQLRTNRQQPRSYREQSFDDDMSDESFTQTDNIDTDDDDDSSSSRQPSPQPRATRERPSTRNRGQAKVSYKEDSDHEPEASQQARSNTSDLASRKRTRTAKAASRPLTSRKKQKVRKGFTKRRPNTKS